MKKLYYTRTKSCHVPTNWHLWLRCFAQIRGGVFDERYVKSSRVRTGRSLRGLSLPPAMCRSERRQVEHVISEALTGMTGEFAGQYYPLKALTPAQTQQLIDVRARYDVMRAYSLTFDLTVNTWTYVWKLLLWVSPSDV